MVEFCAQDFDEEEQDGPGLGFILPTDIISGPAGVASAIINQKTQSKAIKEQERLRKSAERQAEKERYDNLIKILAIGGIVAGGAVVVAMIFKGRK